MENEEKQTLVNTDSFDNICSDDTIIENKEE